MRRAARLATVLLAALATGCGSGRYEGDPAPPGVDKVSLPPAWATDPPAREGYVRWVLVGQSDCLDIARGPPNGRGEYPANQFRFEAAYRLRGLGDARVTEVLRSADVKPAKVREAFHYDPGIPTHEMVVGGQTYTVWELWETPAEPLLSALPAALRPAAASALAQGNAAAGPAWEDVSAPPGWVRDPKPVEGRAPIVTEERSDVPEVAEALATGRGPDSARGSLSFRLVAVLDAATASESAAVAVSRRTVRSRAVQRGRYESLAWILWDVPLDPILAAAPAARRDEVRARALDGHRP